MTSSLPTVAHPPLSWTIHERRGYRFAAAGPSEAPPIVLVHGLFGALSNWDSFLKYHADRYALYVPLLPIYEQSSVEPSLAGLTGYLWQFYTEELSRPAIWIGNSLGGHLALLIAYQHPEAVRALVLTGSSGLFEEGMGSSFPRRSSREYVAERVRYTFYDPRHATPELIDEVFSLVNDSYKALRILKIARDAQRDFIGPKLPHISAPTCLIWGLNDTITPVSTAYGFFYLLPRAELHFIDECGHAPMMEHPERFHSILGRFLQALSS
ncbi:MAG: alpha/beta fold hydrolase [Bacteroidia bacterium]|nr:alpha/beta fold hydrolase [Bacteroidia bacterium]MCX7763622.1 alpha/beta fold hydrolase [Bacteroidia bacterium]MDW8057735.1 alpha/beta fold hydrolase [Bacteroidia bacterium]